MIVIVIVIVIVIPVILVIVIVVEDGLRTAPRPGDRSRADTSAGIY